MAAIIPVYGLDWHMKQSPAQNDLLIKPLQSYVQFEPRSWNGAKLDLSSEQTRRSPVVFFFFPPPPNVLADPQARLIWIPMWDEARWRDKRWWQKLPKNLRIVAFSQGVRKMAQSVGLPSLFLRYFEDPGKLEPAQHNGKRVLFYWNRTGLIGPGFLQDFCRVLEIDLLLFRRNIDPRIPAQVEYSLPSRLGRTIVQEVPGIDVLSREEYLEMLFKTNIMIAPRLSEGVGITFIEALARGCALFGYNAPTMNEYIHHKKNGYLYNAYGHTIGNFIRFYRSEIKQRMGKQRSSGPMPEYATYPITRYQNWEELRRLDLGALGNAARQAQTTGYRFWQNMLPAYAEFILNW